MSSGSGSVKQALLTVIQQTKALVQDLRATGEEVSLFYAAQPPAVLKTKNVEPVKPRVGMPSPVKKIPLPSGDMGVLAAEVQACVACALHGSRLQTVLGEGDLAAKVVFVGEAPGAQEEQEGRPFRGQTGELLDKILAAIGLDRSRVYLCNLLKCRLPGNRNCSPEEIAACQGFLEKQLTLLHPRIICTLGVFAAQTLLQTSEPLSQLRTQTHNYRGIPVIPTFHPESLLYHPQNKRLVWEDMKRLASLLDSEQADRKGNS